MSKTPVSLLQEHLMRLGAMPLYELVLNQSGTHANFFKFKVSYGEMTAIGSGSSKKEAKHDAARALLELLEVPIGPTYHPSRTNTLEIREEIHNEEVNGSLVPENDDGLVEFTSPANNSIGKLNEALKAKFLPQAEFELTTEEGPPHEKLFTITCTVSKQKESATARTKKMAKHMAAEKMLARLVKTIPDVLIPKPKPSSQEPSVYENPLTEVAAAEYCALRGRTKPTTNPTLIKGHHLAYIGHQSPTLKQFVEDTNLIETSSTEELMHNFEKMALEFDMLHKFVKSPFVKQVLPREGFTFMALSIKGIQEITFIGFGSSENEARRDLLCQALHFFARVTSF